MFIECTIGRWQLCENSCSVWFDSYSKWTIGAKHVESVKDTIAFMSAHCMWNTLFV